ncbi:hypothetical protein SBADM41S_00949 [Streptomyces badius]
MAAVVAAAIGSTLLYAGVGALVGDTAARHVGLGSLLFTAAVYDLLLAPFTVPLIMALARRTENDPIAEASSGSNDVAAGCSPRAPVCGSVTSAAACGPRRPATGQPARAGSRGSSACEAVRDRGARGHRVRLYLPENDPRTPSRTTTGGTQ